MKINLNNRSSFWNINSNKNYTNDTLCILNDEFKINILLIPKCASTTIKNIIDYREKLFSQLNDNEKEYTKICFVRPVEERFYSGINTILKRNDDKKINFLNYYNKSLLIEFIEKSLNEHLTSYNIILKNINNYDLYDINILKNYEKKNKSELLKLEYSNIITKIKNLNLFDNLKIKNYYKDDYIYYKNCKKSLPESLKLIFSDVN